ncbi:hypothetical protein K503DRAFT_769619 [Rhizopogon vinicolor AM-OR11-026]|uniref:RING-type domain-containing protein n=1 Tax=Rhizopogon vinicolor AM-OR11-026 TaxID=1314800 RepID=A0A1B7N3B3_9AGAM|nr:hypothetical protein K503DRAFT_769619 [Rhizopogon vinicolor AM-OR11-026]
MEGYATGGNAPYSISCGHVFCQKCLDHLLRHICPLCRSRFSPQDVRRLHIDLQSPTVTTASIEDVTETAPEPLTSPPPDDEARMLQNDIARVVKEGAKLPELRRVIEKCRVYYKSQSADQQNPVKISALLLWNLAESQRHVAEIKKDKAAEIEKTRAVEVTLEDMMKQKAAEVEKTREVKVALEEVHSRLMAELAGAQLKYQELQRIRQDEKDTAVAVETSLREHYDELDKFWKSKFEAITRENKALREELARARIAFNPLPDFQRPIEVRYFHATEPKFPVSENLIEDDPLTLKARAKAKAKAKAIEDEEFHLSPLAQVIGTWPSAIQSFRALVDEDDDLKKTCRIKEAELKSEEEDGDQRMGDALATPLPIPRSRQLTDSSMSSSVATVNPDSWSALSRSRPDDIVMSSRPPSPSRPASTERSSNLVRSSAHSPSRRLSREQSMSYVSSRTASPSRRYSSDRPYVNRIKETYSRDSYDVGNRDYESRPGDPYEPKLKDQLATRQSVSSDDFRDRDRERLRAQLHDILDSPMASSTLHMSHRDESSMPPPMPPPPPLSSTIPRSTTASTRVQTPLRTISMSQQVPSTTSTPAPEEGYSAPVVPKTLVHASSVAMQQEKERREREKQRELERERADRDWERRDRDRDRGRDRERERELEWQSYPSLKDATNAPPDAYYRERTTGRARLANPGPVAAVAHG